MVILGGTVRLYVGFAAVAAVTLGDPALVVAGYLQGAPQLSIRAVVSTLHAAVGIALAVCTLALALLLTEPKARILLLRHHTFQTSRLLPVRKDAASPS